MAQHYCKKCGKTMEDNQFYKSRRLDRYPPDGTLDTCKKCLTMHVDNWDPETYKWILEEVDIPYIKDEWDGLLEKYGKDPQKITGLTIIGRYLSKMKLKQWSKYSWEDTTRLEEDALQRKISAMKAQGLSGEDIEEQLAIDHTPPKPKDLAKQQEAVGTPEYVDYENQADEFSDNLTEEDKTMLRLKWGRGYRAEEWVRLEQLYRDFMDSYDIQTAGHKDTLIMICKTSLKTNQLLDAGDIEGAQKMSKVYDTLMRSGKFTAAQNKEESGEYVDSIGEIVAICEKDGFIPRYYVDNPKDKIDRIIQDMQEYTHDLVTEELGLGNLIENSVKALEREKEAIKDAAENSEDNPERALEESLFNYKTSPLEDKDFAEFSEFKESEREGDLS